MVAVDTQYQNKTGEDLSTSGAKYDHLPVATRIKHHARALSREQNSYQTTAQSQDLVTITGNCIDHFMNDSTIWLLVRVQMNVWPKLAV